ncbi:MAG: cupin domain-containing protein, partial [Pyrinomonadaceae bacterium]
MKIPKAMLRNQDNSPVYVSDNSVYTILAAGADTDGIFSVVEQSADNGTQTPWHLHENQAETFYVMDGAVTFWVADKVYQAKKGAFISIPKNTRHRFEVISSKTRILNSFYPAGFEQFYINNLPEAKTGLTEEDKPELNWQIIGDGKNDWDTVLLDKESNLDHAGDGGEIPFIRYRTDGPGLWGLGLLWVVMADAEQTSSVHSFIDELIPQGPSAAPHIHQAAEEIFYILDGEMTFFTGDEWKPLKATPNSLVVVPKGTKHSFQIDTPTVHLV